MFKIILPVILVALFVWGFTFGRDTLKKISIPASIREIVVENTKETCDEECKKIIQEEVAKAISSASVKTKELTKVPTTPTSQTSYINLGGTYSTTSASWVDVPGSEATLNLKKDYGEGAQVSFQGSLKVTDGNGQAQARLYDSTNSMAVYGSEISTSNNSSYQSVSSGNLNLWDGYNTYKVQIKSSNSKEITFTGGGLKIVTR